MPYKIPKKVLVELNKNIADAINDSDAIAETASSIIDEVVEAVAQDYNVPWLFLRGYLAGYGKGNKNAGGQYSAPAPVDGDLTFSDAEVKVLKDEFGE